MLEGNVITFENNRKYYVNQLINYRDEIYVMMYETNSEETDLADTPTFFKLGSKGNELFFEDLSMDELNKLLSNIEVKQ